MKTAETATIRDFRAADIDEVHRLIEETIERSYGGLYPPRAVAFFKDFHAEEKILERSRKGKVLVVERAGEVIGTGSFSGTEIFAVFVHPDWQGTGLGKALMRRLEAEALASSVTEARLSVSLVSRHFYESLGYRLIEACSKDVGEGQRLDFWKARKSLESL